MARRFSIAGTSRSGKTTVGRALAGRLGVPHIEVADWLAGVSPPR